MRFLLAIALIGLLAGSSYAQDKPVAKYHEADKDKSAAEKAADVEAERAYKRSLGNIPDQGPSDPWGNVRSDGAPKAVAKSSAAKPSAAKPSAAKPFAAKSAVAKDSVANSAVAKQAKPAGDAAN
jgi:hypothetical protein